jgi:Xaa-Pro dipeptidase
MHLEALQSAIRDQNLDGWLFYDHHHRDPIAYRILGLDEHSFVSRRWYYFVPATGEPRKLVHRIEAGKLDSLPGTKREYSSWQELEAEVAAMTLDANNIAMQYSPRNAIMYVSMVDAGTVELLRSMSKNIVSSANLVSIFEAVLTEAQIDSHYVAQQRLDEVLRSGWQHISQACASGRGTDELEVVRHLLQGIERAGLFTDHGPNCSAGPNSADSHYEPADASSRSIGTGDFVLIDIWAKVANDPSAVWYDITWTGVIGRAPSERETEIFNFVRDARVAACKVIEDAYAADRPIAGWQADDAARSVLLSAGYGKFFTHRTGHNIATELHGNGAHLDNLETHDDRLLLPNTCFSVEPGLYFPGDFGVRSEVNMITRPGQAVVTGPAQNELLSL